MSPYIPYSQWKRTLWRGWGRPCFPLPVLAGRREWGLCIRGSNLIPFNDWNKLQRATLKEWILQNAWSWLLLFMHLFRDGAVKKCVGHGLKSLQPLYLLSTQKSNSRKGLQWSFSFSFFWHDFAAGNREEIQPHVKKQLFCRRATVEQCNFALLHCWEAIPPCCAFMRKI